MKVTRLISEVTAFGFGEDKHRSLQQYTVQPRSVVAKVTLALHQNTDCLKLKYVYRFPIVYRSIKRPQSLITL